jgi:hypothetical protein
VGLRLRDVAESSSTVSVRCRTPTVQQYGVAHQRCSSTVSHTNGTVSHTSRNSRHQACHTKRAACPNRSARTRDRSARSSQVKQALPRRLSQCELECSRLAIARAMPQCRPSEISARDRRAVAFGRPERRVRGQCPWRALLHGILPGGVRHRNGVVCDTVTHLIYSQSTRGVHARPDKGCRPRLVRRAMPTASAEAQCSH